MKRPFPVVIIVDDDPDGQLRLKRAFAECRQDLRIRCFTTAEDLLGHLRQSSKDAEEGSLPDLVLVNLHLPEKSALKLLEEIKTHSDLRRIPLIMLNGPPSDPEIRQCYELGANTVMTKPILFDELVQALRTLCDYWFGPVRM
jgi:two-component system, response regulator